MKKKIAALVCTFALVAAMPVMAWADPSPQYVPAESGNAGNEQDVSLQVKGQVSDGGWIKVDATTGTQASNVELTSTMKVLGSYEITHKGDAKGPFTFTFSGLDKYNGATVTVFIEHTGDFAYMGTEVQTATVVNGTVTITTNGLSTVTIAVDTATVPEGGSTSTAKASTDSSATSPQTDVDLSGVAGATVACAVAAAGVGIALRKKATK